MRRKSGIPDTYVHDNSRDIAILYKMKSTRFAMIVFLLQLESMNLCVWMDSRVSLDIEIIVFFLTLRSSSPQGLRMSHTRFDGDS